MRFRCVLAKVKYIDNMNFTCIFFNVALRKIQITCVACIVFPSDTGKEV